MRIFSTKVFDKSFAKLPTKIQARFEVRIEMFRQNPFDRVLENHPLTGNLLGLRSFSVTGDYRVKFEVQDDQSVKLIDIGRHPSVYKRD